MGQGDQDISLRRIFGVVGYFLFCACIEPEYVRNLLSRVENIARKRPGPNHNKTDPLKNRRLSAKIWTLSQSRLSNFTREC
ncbi:MAG: hypothetical protein ACI9PY_000613 [Ascidiaceihabitans sp.]|jgi:hypothetical protein